MGPGGSLISSDLFDIVFSHAFSADIIADQTKNTCKTIPQCTVHNATTEGIFRQKTFFSNMLKYITLGQLQKRMTTLARKV